MDSSLLDVKTVKIIVRFLFSFLSYKVKGPSEHREVGSHGRCPDRRAILA